MSIEIIKRSERAKTVAELFKGQYYQADRGWSTYAAWPKQPEQMHADIVACNGDATCIEAAMSGLRWTTIYCRQCGEHKPVIAELDVDWESGSTICLECAKALVADLDRAEQEEGSL